MFNVTQNVVSLLGIPQQFSGSAAMTGESQLSAAGNVKYIGSAALVAESALAATGIAVIRAAVAMTAESSFNTSVTRYTQTTAIIVGESNLTATARHIYVGVVSMSAESSLYAAGGFVYVASPSPMTSDSTLDAPAVRVQPATASLTADMSMSSTAEPIYRLNIPTKQYAYSNNILFSRYRVDVGVSLLITDGVGALVEIPDQVALNAADWYFQGGLHHQLNQGEYDAVSSAGFADLVEVA